MRILLLADIHIGSITDTNYVYSVMTGIIDKEIISTKTDAVVILGDYFDRLFKANEEYVGLAVNIMSYLVMACKRNDTKIRIIYGTESHEMNQYKIFNHHFRSKDIDMKLFTTVTEENLCGVDVLYVPEEYMKDKEEFYKDTIYSGKHYKYIFGHGMIREGLQNSQFIKQDTSGEAKVPFFNSQELSSIADIIVFGHIHIGYDCGNIHYIGSLFRDSFGEEKEKRYGIIEDDEITFVENKKAYIYDTFEFFENSDIYKSPDNLVKHINDIKENYNELLSGEQQGKIRLIFYPPVDADPSFFDTLKSILFNDKIFKSVVKEVERTLVEEDDIIEDKYEFVLDKVLKPEDKIYKLIDLNNEEHMTFQELEDYIFNPLKI